MRVAVLSDTHLPRRGPGLPALCIEVMARADLILHAGDLCDFSTLILLRAFGPPVAAVHGNVDEPDVRRELPETAVVEAGGLRIGMVHDAGVASGRLERMRRRFPDANGVVFGHSHIPLFHRAGDGFFILNPGSPTDRRRQPRHSIVELTIEEGARPEPAFLAVDYPVGSLPDALVRR
ncbi:MAG: YfcE family phosphodiesterase [Thermoleophilia bacterium]|nr:YfcE family phosphodiesterase [Thermoleophilia bacterium]MDH3724429.1 YfcE family phosphodiesterase [Thermoleophilia bacterium]